MKSPWHTPALRGVLGSWVFYPSLLSSAQIAQHVLPAKEIRESKALDDHLQRDLKPRVKKITRYLRSRDSRFFNAILLGVFDAAPNWVEFDLTTVAEKLHLHDVSEAQSSMGLLTFTGAEKIFAIDGQHRIEAIREGNRDFPEKIKGDQYAVIFLAHDDTKTGKVRTRRLFSDINKNAVPVSGGDKVIIDEDEGPAIVTRRIYAEYSRFKGGKEIAVTEKIERVSKDGKEYFTSLLAIHTVAKKLKKLFRKPRGSLESEPENVAAFQAIVATFFDFIIEREPSLRRYFIEHKTTPEKERRVNRSLVFRPIGLELLARLYVHFKLAEKLPVFDWALKNLQWECPGGVWDGTVWLREKIQPGGKAKTAAIDYVLYLLHELPDRAVADLTARLQALRNDDDYALPARAKFPAVLAQK
jgi:DNA sulfur modification protein DndB